MAERTRSQAPGPTSQSRPRSETPPRQSPSVAGALALQRAVGNRAATKVLQRWAAHPDKDKKGVFMPDAMAAEFTRFNPPLSK
ncbi:MAG: hypothetical protein ACXVRW_11095 [Solirubrobacteraceae bacterium]